MDRIVIFGGTGFIGTGLATYLEDRGMEPIIIARYKPSKALKYKFVEWDGFSLGSWVDELEGAKAIINLAGKSVDCVKTPENCDLILRSRINSTQVIGLALRKCKKPPEVWVQTSTASIYGDPPSHVCHENSAPGYGFAPFVAKAWEEVFSRFENDISRCVILRISLVIGRNGGVLKKLIPLIRLGLGGKVGHGRQGMSWIHEQDMNAIIYQAITNSNYHGVYNCASPNPVSNKEFMSTVRKSMGVLIGLPAFAFMVKIAARYILKTDHELVLFGRYVKSEKLKDVGFEFKFPDLKHAMEDLMRKN